MTPSQTIRAVSNVLLNNRCVLRSADYLNGGEYQMVASDPQTGREATVEVSSCFRARPTAHLLIDRLRAEPV